MIQTDEATEAEEKEIELDPDLNLPIAGLAEVIKKLKK